MSKKKKTITHNTTVSQAEQRSATWAAGQIGDENYFFLIVCVCAQLLTVLITWPLWEIRQSPINLPWISGLPQIPFGVLIIISLIGVLISPKRLGLVIHLAVMALAMLSDQIRCQPQVLWIVVLTIACVWQQTKQLCIWALVSLWLWAGIHKAISYEWFHGNAVQLMFQAGITDTTRCGYWFALLVAVSEIAQGVLAILRPRLASITCGLLHLGIAGFLILIYWNLSVLPWNFCTAIVGTWLMFHANSWRGFLAVAPPQPTDLNESTEPTTINRWLNWSLVAVVLILPAGYYTGHVRHCFAHLLYSGGLPRASISKADQTVEQLTGWKHIRVPFPHEPKAFRDYFCQTAAPGEKLHIHEVRPWLNSRYYLLDDFRQPQEISRATFFGSESGVAGIGFDDRSATFELINNRAAMKRRTEESMIFAVEFTPEYFSADLLDLVRELPNVEEIQLQGCDVSDDDLKKLATLNRLEGIGLNETSITHQGLQHLSEIKGLKFIQYNGVIYGSIEEIIEKKNE